MKVLALTEPSTVGRDTLARCLLALLLQHPQQLCLERASPDRIKHESIPASSILPTMEVISRDTVCMFRSSTSMDLVCSVMADFSFCVSSTCASMPQICQRNEMCTHPPNTQQDLCILIAQSIDVTGLLFGA